MHNLVRCYSVGQPTDDVHQYTDTSAVSKPGQALPDGSDRVSAALDSCSLLWKIGLIQPGKIDRDAVSYPGDRPYRTSSPAS